MSPCGPFPFLIFLVNLVLARLHLKQKAQPRLGIGCRSHHSRSVEAVQRDVAIHSVKTAWWNLRNVGNSWVWDGWDWDCRKCLWERVGERFLERDLRCAFGTYAWITKAILTRGNGSSQFFLSILMRPSSPSLVAWIKCSSIMPKWRPSVQPWCSTATGWNLANWLGCCADDLTANAQQFTF